MAAYRDSRSPWRIRLGIGWQKLAQTSRIRNGDPLVVEGGAIIDGFVRNVRVANPHFSFLGVESDDFGADPPGGGRRVGFDDRSDGYRLTPRKLPQHSAQARMRDQPSGRRSVSSDVSILNCEARRRSLTRYAGGESSWSCEWRCVP